MIEFAKSLALEAGQILRDSQTQVVEKKPGSANWVTTADLAVEAFLNQSISAAFPDHLIITEETDIPRMPQASDKRWINDPLDGTTNATFGVPHYGISLAYMEKGQVVASVILDVPNNRLYWAQKDKGAFVDSRKLQIPERRLDATLVASASPYGRKDFKLNLKLMDKIHAAGNRLVMFGSAVIAAVSTAEGKVSLYFEYGLKPWDVAAAKLIIEEAGGVAESFKGKLDIFHPQTFVCGSRQAVKDFQTIFSQGNSSRPK